MMIRNAMQAHAAATSRGEACVITSSIVLSRIYHCTYTSPMLQISVSMIFTVGSTATGCACSPSIAPSIVSAAGNVLERNNTQVIWSKV